jgi:hypothetical protein
VVGRPCLAHGAGCKRGSRKVTANSTIIVHTEDSLSLDYGAHLPLIALDRQPWALQRLLEYAVSAESVGFQALAANDHLVFPRPWLDGPTALAAVLGRTGQMAVAPHVSAWRG